jgi:hypothetical protein
LANKEKTPSHKQTPSHSKGRLFVGEKQPALAVSVPGDPMSHEQPKFTTAACNSPLVERPSQAVNGRFPCFTPTSHISPLKASNIRAIYQPDEKHGNHNNRRGMRKMAPMLGKDWVENLSASPKARQSHFVGHLPATSF